MTKEEILKDAMERMVGILESGLDEENLHALPRLVKGVVKLGKWALEQEGGE